MRATIDKDTCIGCGLCAEISPEVFEMNDDNKARVATEIVSQAQYQNVEEAADSCPVNAIELN